MADDDSAPAASGGGGRSARDAQDAIAGNRVFQLVASGMTVVEAAGQLGMSTSAADRQYRRALAEARTFSAEEKQERIQAHLEAYRLLHRAHMPNALKGGVGAAQIVLATLKAERELLGMDEAIQVEVSTTKVTEAVQTIIELVDREVPLEPPPGLPALPPMPEPAPPVPLEVPDQALAG